MKERWGVGVVVGLLNVIYVPCDGYGIHMPILRSAGTFSCRFDVALQLFVVSEH